LVAVALAACGGSDSSISGVVPGDVFAGREVDVLVSGDNTDWGDDVEITFGEGVTAGTVTVASPTALWVHITVAADAELGPRTVTVDGDEFADAFNVISALKVTSIAGPLAQGSVATVKVQSLDFTTPFDTAAGNLAIEVADDAGIQVVAGTADAYTFDFQVFTDVDAPAAPIDLALVSGPPGGATVEFNLPAAFSVEARDAEVVPITELGGTFGPGGDSALFKVDPASLDVVTVAGLFDSPDGSVAFYILGDSGRFDDIIAVGAPSFFDPNAIATFLTNEPFYVVVADASGTGGYQFLVDAVVEASIGDEVLAEDDANDTSGAAQAAAAPIMVNGSLADDTDVDWYEVVVPAENDGDTLVVFTTAGPSNTTDTTVSFFEDDGTTAIGDEIDNNYGETAISEPLAAGTYLVRIQNTGGSFTPSPGPYDMAVGFGQPPSD
jgi:hypothetical protein